MANKAMDKSTDKAKKVVEFLTGSGDLSKTRPTKKHGSKEPKLPRL